jgi:predicted MFS family arabinose efflux permease
MLFRIVQEALLLAVVALMAALLARRFPRVAGLIARVHLPASSLEPRRLMIVGAVAGATRALLHGGVLALRGETLAPLHVPSSMAYLGIAGALVGLARRSGAGHTGAQALAAAVGGAAVGAGLGCVPLIVRAYPHEIASASTALIATVLGAIAWPPLRRTAWSRRVLQRIGRDAKAPDPLRVIACSVPVAILLASVLVPTGIEAPPPVIVLAVLALATAALGRTARGREALHRVRVWLADLGEEVRTKTDTRGLTPMIVGVAAGISTNPAYFWTPLTGFLVEDMGVSERAAGALNGWAFAGLATGTFLVAPLAGRWDQRRVLVRLTLLGAAAVSVFAFVPELPVMRAATFVAASMSLASSIALPPILAGAESRSRASGLFARSWILTIAVLLTVEPIVAGWTGWEKVAMGQAALMLLAAPLMLLPRTGAAVPDPRPAPAVWAAAVRMLRERRMWIFAAIYFLSGGLYGVFNATYAPVLGSAGLAMEAWIPGLALFIAAYGAKSWGDFSHGRGRAGLVLAAVISTLPFVAVAPLAFWESPIALGGVALIVLLTIQNLGLEAGTTGTTVVGPAVLLDDNRAHEENALANTAKFAGMAGFGWLAASLLDSRSLMESVARPGVLGAVAGVALVVLSATVPLQHGTRPKPRRGRVASGPRRAASSPRHRFRWTARHREAGRSELHW